MIEGVMKRVFLPMAFVLVLLSDTQANAGTLTTETYDGRKALIYTPSTLPPSGARAMVVVLHGGLGNARRIEAGSAEGGLNMDRVAEADGFVVAYLNGTRAMRRVGPDMLAWNAGGGCCGLPAQEGVDDVGYIKGAVAALGAKYGVDAARVYGIGHSNGAIMTLAVMCEAGVYAAGVSVSGPLNLDVASCPAASGRRILAIHGAEDQNVPIAGGRGAKGISGATFRAAADSRDIFLRSGAAYTLDIVPGADHTFAHIDSAVQASDGMTIARKAAQFFGLEAVR